jgi:geranylgeranyl diphosphate synthase type II
VSPEPLSTFLAAARAAVDAALERYLPSPPMCPAIVSDAMRYSVFAGGKRLRPALTLAAADAVARQGREGVHRSDVADSLPPAVLQALPAACAIEMIHTYSLIHDDLPAMDNDTLRRGRPTLHVVHGEGIAILAGDGLLTEAFALLATRPESSSSVVLARRLRTLGEIADAAGAAGMVGGQAIDLQAVGSGSAERQAAVPLSFDALRDMHARKTGALIRASSCNSSHTQGSPSKPGEREVRPTRYAGVRGADRVPAQ